MNSFPLPKNEQLSIPMLERFSQLQVQEVLVEDDIPHLVLSSDAEGALFIGVAAKEIDGGVAWIYAPISKLEYRALGLGAASVLQVFEKEHLHVVYKTWEGFSTLAYEVNRKEIPELFLPRAGALLPSDVRERLAEAAGASTEATLSTLNGKVTTCNTGAIAGTVAVSNFPATQAVSAVALPLPSGAATEATLAAIGKPSTLIITAKSVVNTTVTATLPAVAGQFHYITSIQITKLYNVVGVASGAGVDITTTNLPGSLAFTTEQLASAAGTAVKVVDMDFTSNPLKSSAANTVTTIVCPQQLQTIWRVVVSYYTAP